jgi:hypothetical protein
VSFFDLFRAWRDTGSFAEAYFEVRFSPPRAPLPGYNPLPGRWSEGHARNMAYKYQREVAPMYRDRPSWPTWAERWDNQPKGWWATPSDGQDPTDRHLWGPGWSRGNPNDGPGGGGWFW